MAAVPKASPAAAAARGGSVGGPFSSAYKQLLHLGLRPVPIDRQTKAPLVYGWQKPRSLETLAEWACRFPDADVGTVTGESTNLVVVDLDSRCPEMLAEAEMVFGETPLLVGTPHGWHLYYRWGGEACGRLQDGLLGDLKGRGGLVRVPPSFGLVLERGSWNDLSELPALWPTSGVQPRAPQAPKGEGERNNALFRYALDMAPFCDDLAALLDAIRGFNLEQLPPQGELEVERTATSAWGYQKAGRNYRAGASGVTIRYTEVEALSGHKNASDALMLFVVLRRSHGAQRGKQFALVCKRMASANVVPGWKGEKRYTRAREALAAMGLIEKVRAATCKRGPNGQVESRVPAQWRFPRPR